MSTNEEYQVPVRDGHTALPAQTPEEIYWMRHMSREELLEKLVSLREDFYTVKKFSCRQEDKIKKLQTKLRRLISDKKRDDKEGASSSLKEMEYQEAIETQELAIRDMRLKTQQLEKKLKLANIQLSSAKKNRPMLFRHVGPKVDSGLKHRTPSVSSRPPSSHQTRAATAPSSNESPAHCPSPSNQQTDQVMPERIREVLEEARQRIVALEAEKDDLQDQLEERHQSAEEADYEASQKICLLEEEVASLKEELHQQGVREERSSVAAVKAERESHTLSARTIALEEQLLVTEEKVASEKLRKDALNSDLERMTEKLLGVENQLRGVQEEQQKTAGKLQEINEKNKVLENENRQLKSENDRLTSLNLSFEQKGLARENESLKAQVAHLESALQSDLTERGSFLEHMSQDKGNLIRAEQEIKELKEKLISLQQDLQNANTKLTVYDKAGLLKLPDKDPTLLPPRVSAPSPKEFEKLREAHSELQLLYREKSRELEQLSVTLSSHSTTYQALQTQVSKVTQESVEKEKLMNMTIRSLEDTIKRRDDRCDKLETQILTLTDKGIRENLEDLGPPSLTQTVGLGKRDNLLEFHIDRVVFELSDFTHLKTFVSWTVPFSLEDPLQHTNVARGTEPHYNYSALYKFQVNNRNLMSLKEDTVTASVYILLDSGHPAKVGECGLTFQEILDHPRNTLHGTVPVVLVHDDAEEVQHLDFIANTTPGQVIGSMSYWFRLQRPSEDAIAQYLRTSGMVSAAQKKAHPKMETRAPKAITSPVKKKSISKEVDHQVKDVQMTKTEGKDLHVEAPHMSTPIQDNSPLPPDKNNSSVHKSESSESPRDNTKGHITSNSPSPQTNSHRSIKADLVKQQLTHSRSASVSSSKSKAERTRKSKSNSDTDEERRQKSSKPKRVDSEGSSEGSSIGTYNIESPKLFKESESSASDTSKALKNKPKRKESESSSPSQSLRRNSKSEKSSSTHNMSISAKSSSHVREKGNAEMAEVKPSTSKMSSASPSKLSPAMASNTPSRSQAVSSEESPDTSLDEEVSSDASHTHTSDDVMSQRKDDHRKIYLEVASLTLLPDCGVLQDPTVELIFVDYHGFLGLPPDQLETPTSMSKHSPGNTLNFNFGQEFSIDKKEFPSRYLALSELMGGRGILKFTITSEPSEDKQDTHDCQDLGYAYIDLHKLAREEEDLVDGALSVESAEDGSQIGVLKVTIQIIKALEYLDLV